MSKKYNIKAVIGSNYGDEGKGLLTNYFAEQAKNKNESCVVVLSNGGPQRGHTVIGPNGERHVFHHFGSGTFQGADTYIPNHFLINPMIFRQEYEELEKLGYKPRCYISSGCLVTTPYDMLANQIEEIQREKNKHGSCGQGIWKTIKRNGFLSFRWGDTKFISKTSLENWILSIKQFHFKVRDIEHNLVDIPKEYSELIDSNDLLERYISDLKWMDEKCNTTYHIDSYTLRNYKNIIFENGQGLLLDQKYGDHTTPSNTGMQNINIIINDCFNTREYDFEACYVSRTYMTRHGAGPFLTECPKENINPDMFDQTNIPNPFQDSIRYGTLDYKDLFKRVEEDYNEYYVPGKLSIAMTHCNEYPCNSNDERIRYKFYEE